MRVPAFVAVMAIVTADPAWCASRDVEVMATVLEHFAARTDSMSMHHAGITLIRHDTYPWTAELIRGLSLRRDEAGCEIPEELYDRLIESNVVAQPAALLIPTSDKWRLAQAHEEQFSRIDILDKTSDGQLIKTVAHVSMPAYSRRGEAAFVTFFFRWSIHQAVAQYLMRKHPNGWRVDCSRLTFYP